MLKRKMGFKFLFIMMIAFSVLLAACGKSDGNNGDTEGNAGKSSEETYDLTMAFLATSNVDDYKKVQDEINKITKEKINATVSMLPISPSAWGQQMNLMMTGDEDLDLVVTGDDLGYSLQATKGMLIPLDELLTEYGEGIKEVVPADALEVTRINDEIFGVPSVRDWAADFGFYMRTDLLEKHDINLDDVKTFEDLTPIFELIKEKEPDVFPIANTTVPVGEIISQEPYDVLGDRLGVVKMGGNGEVINMFEDQDYIDSIKLVREWYDKGFIMKDSSTMEDTDLAVVKAGKGFGAFSIMKPGFEAQQANFIGQEVTALRLTEPFQYSSYITSFMMSIARNSENPEKAMEFMNLMYSDEEIANLIVNGIEGEHYVINDEGFATLPEGVEESNYFMGQWQLGNNFLTHVWEGDDLNLWEKTQTFNDEAIKSPVFGFTFNPDSVKSEVAAITNVIEQYKKGIESGTLDPEKNLEEFNNKLRASGLDKIIEEKQKQINEWKETQ